MVQVITIRSAVRVGVKTPVEAFCGLFVLSLIGYSLGVLWSGDDWQTNSQMRIAGRISTVALATAILMLGMGRVAVVLYRLPGISRSKSLEEGHRRQADARLRDT